MDYTTLAYYCVIGTFVVIAIRELRLFAIQRVKANAQIAKNANKPEEFAGLSSLVANVDDILSQLYKLRDEQQAAGASEVQLKPLVDRIKWMERIKDNRSWLQYIAPHADGLIGTGIKAIQKIVENL